MVTVRFEMVQDTGERLILEYGTVTQHEAEQLQRYVLQKFNGIKAHRAPLRPQAIVPFDTSRIRPRRAELEMSRRDLAARIGVSESYVGLLELGQRKPSQPTARKLREWLGDED